MKEFDAVSRFAAEIERMDSLERQLRLAESPIQRALRESRRMEVIIPKNAFDFGSVLALQPTTLGLIEVMRKSFYEAERLRGVGVAEAMLEARSQLDRQTAMLFGKVQEAAQIAQLEFGLQLKSNLEAIEAVKFQQTRWIEDIQSVSVRISELARKNFTFPETALLHWSGKVLAARAPLLEDCILNTAALGEMQVTGNPSGALDLPERLALATDFVFQHAEAVRKLPPHLPRPEDEELMDGTRPRGEEIGARLELALGTIDARLVSLRKRAWSNLAGGDIAGARLAMAGIRELFDEVLRLFAPDDVVAATPEWVNRNDPELLKLQRPTRRVRVAYVLGDAAIAELDALFQFEKSIRRMQGYVHAFAADPELVRAAMTSMEVWIHFLVHYGTRRSRSS